MRRIAVVGTGYVGLTAGACLAALGHRVICADVDPDKVERLSRGEIGIFEPGLADLAARGIAAGRLSFVLGATAAATTHTDGGAELVILCVPTPMDVDGGVDLTVVDAVIDELKGVLRPGAVLVNKSTVPVGAAARIAERLDRDDIAVVSNPEFLREGSAVEDFLNPDRIVIGCDTQHAADRVAALYARLGAPTVFTDTASAELVKYAANCFLAMKLSYVNAIAELCERMGADITLVTEAMGYDQRIGRAFLKPGPSWGGSCLPKDTSAMLQIADSVGFDFGLLRATIDTNERQRQRIADKVRLAVTGRRSGSLSQVRLGLLGLTFKANTDDLRDSPALAVAALLSQSGAELVGYDPALSPCAAYQHLDNVHVVGDPYLAAKDTDALVLLTEWPEFRTLDWTRIAGMVRRPIVVDARNLLDDEELARAGFAWTGLGR